VQSLCTLNGSVTRSADLFMFHRSQEESKVLSMLQNQTLEKSKRNNTCWEKNEIEKRNSLDSKKIVRHSTVTKSGVVLLLSTAEGSWKVVGGLCQGCL